MNLLIVPANTLKEEVDLFPIYGPKVDHLIRERALSVGALITIGEIGSDLVKVEVKEIVAKKKEGNEIWVQRLSSENAPGPLPLELILAINRPIMMRRILISAVCLGVRRIFLVQTSRVDRNYLRSNLLSKEAITEALIEGLEQARTTFLPEVLVIKSWWELNELSLIPMSTRTSALKVVADPRPTSFPNFNLNFSQTICHHEPIIYDSGILAIGPESGWSAEELEAFDQRSFMRLSFGPRILKVETAVTCGLAQLCFILQLAQKHR